MTGDRLGRTEPVSAAQPMGLDRNGLEVLSRAQCFTLLAGQTVGRVALSSHALPTILPITYGLVGDDIVFATGTGMKSVAVTHQTVIAFEADEIDKAGRTGWSVLAIGVGHQLIEGDPDWDAAVNLHLRPWVGRHAVHLIRLATDRLSGRRLDHDVHPVPVALSS